MVVAVWLLGVGTLKDLALVQLVGVIVGTYSSIFFATPLLVTLRERTELVRTHTRRVLNRRKPTRRGRRRAAESERPTRHRRRAGDRRRRRCVGSRQAPGRRQARPGRAADPTRLAPGGRRASGTPGGGKPRSLRTAGEPRRGGHAVGAWACSPCRVLGRRRRRDRLRRRRHADHLQHQHRRRRGVGRSAGVRAGADRLQLPRPGRPDGRRPRLRHHRGRRPRAAGARLPDQRQRGVLRRQADHLRRHGAGLGGAVGPVSGLRRGQPGRLHRHRHGRLRARAEEGPGDVRPGPRRSSTSASCSPRRR